MTKYRSFKCLTRSCSLVAYTNTITGVLFKTSSFIHQCWLFLALSCSFLFTSLCCPSCPGPWCRDGRQVAVKCDRASEGNLDLRRPFLPVHLSFSVLACPQSWFADGLRGAGRSQMGGHTARTDLRSEHRNWLLTHSQSAAKLLSVQSLKLFSQSS